MKIFLKIILLLSVVFSFSCTEKKVEDEIVVKMKNGELNDSTNYQEHINQNYQIFSMPLPKNLSFAGERVPLENLLVRDKLDREILVNTYWHSNTFLYHKRANRWFPIIEKVLAKNNMPDDLKYLALIESGLTNATSPAGAKGFWQFMHGTGRDYGLVINDKIDERNNVEKSTEAACKYLKVAHAKFGSWALAAASYNMGKGGVNNVLTRQDANSYYDLHLNTETARYVYRILAAKLILSNSKNFGFNIREKELYKPYKTYAIKVDSSISDLVQFAKDQGTNYSTLRVLNPWFTGYSLDNLEGKIYTIKLPRGNFNVVEEFEYMQDSSITLIDTTLLIKDTLTNLDSINLKVIPTKDSSLTNQTN